MSMTWCTSVTARRGISESVHTASCVSRPTGVAAALDPAGFDQRFLGRAQQEGRCCIPILG